MTAIDRFGLIIGAMKCGTTSLFYYLAQHPEICPSRLKEPAFFATKWEQGPDWYHALYDWAPSRHRVAIEASTHYTRLPQFPNVPDRIATIPARFKFVYLVRNPLDRAESQYNHARTMPWPVGAAPLSEGLHARLIDWSRYAMQIDAYTALFPR